MEPTKHVSELKPADYNPRKMSNEDAKALKKSIDELGDLGGIIKNIATGNLVGGHQRVEVFKRMTSDPEIEITWRTTETPGPGGTTALGYIIHPTTGERFAYREVNWILDSTDANGVQFSSKEKVANVAANRIQGEWDLEALAHVNYDLSQQADAEQLLALTGQDEKELERLNKMIGVGDDEQPDEIGEDPKDSDKREIRATKEQWEIIDEALENIKATKEIPSEDNGSRNGSALYYMAREYLDRLQGLTNNEQPVTPTPSSDNLVA